MFRRRALRFGLVDRIYTRIGASDNVARGRSTFMVEMTETATILNTATKRSLILLDEMGRGTATFDGLSLAWATVEYLHAETGARTLFATHYHELTMLAEKLPRVRNLRVGVKEGAGGIVFLHNIEPGAASKSYGIEVARLAGLPAAVIERARHVLRQHEKQERQSVQVETAPEPMQMTIFTPLSQRIVDRIEATDVNALTPLQALNLLEELQQELKEKDHENATVRQAAGSLLVVGLGGNRADRPGTRMARGWSGRRQSFSSSATSPTHSRHARCSTRPPDSAAPSRCAASTWKAERSTGCAMRWLRLPRRRLWRGERRPTLRRNRERMGHPECRHPARPHGARARRIDRARRQGLRLQYDTGAGARSGAAGSAEVMGRAPPARMQQR